jgi:hypothetical protein
VKGVAQFLRGHPRYVLWTRHAANGIGDHSGNLAKIRADDKN